MRHVQESPPRPGRLDRHALQLMASYNQLRTVRCQAREGAISIDADAVKSEMWRGREQDPIAAVNFGESIFYSASEMECIA